MNGQSTIFDQRAKLSLGTKQEANEVGIYRPPGDYYITARKSRVMEQLKHLIACPATDYGHHDFA